MKIRIPSLENAVKFLRPNVLHWDFYNDGETARFHMWDDPTGSDPPTWAELSLQIRKDNAIWEYYEYARKREELGMTEDQVLNNAQVTEMIIKAGSTRLRPVLLTAITTVLGLIPLATGLNFDFEGLLTRFNPNIYWGGDNAEFWGPMSWTIIFGLTFATFLTLILVPVMYSLMEQLSRRLRGYKEDKAVK